jgi:hypothetical protein
VKITEQNVKVTTTMYTYFAIGASLNIADANVVIETKAQEQTTSISKRRLVIIV